MKVKELIKKLETMDPEMEAAYCDVDHGWVLISNKDVFVMEAVPVWDTSKSDLKDNVTVVAIG